jgi:hypothetical protein
MYTLQAGRLLSGFFLLLTRTRGILFHIANMQRKRRNEKLLPANRRRESSRIGAWLCWGHTLPSSFSLVLFKKHLHSREPSLPRSHNWNLYHVTVLFYALALWNEIESVFPTYNVIKLSAQKMDEATDPRIRHERNPIDRHTRMWDSF